MTIQLFVEDCILQIYREDYMAAAQHYIFERDAVPLLFQTLTLAIEIQANPTKEKGKNYLSSLSKPNLERVVFRSAYIFEVLYQQESSIIKNENFNFLSLFFQIKSKSAQRIFLKALATALENDDIKITNEEAEQLVETITAWAIDPKTKVAIQAYAFDCLHQLRYRSAEAPVMIEHLVEIFKQIDMPATRSKLRKWGYSN